MDYFQIIGLAMEPIIYHVDVNSAFLSWEASYRVNILGEPNDLRDIPSVIGGSEESRHGIVLAKSIPCKPFNIQTGEPLVKARKKCPGLVVVPPNYEMYVTASKSLVQMLHEFSPKVMQYSIDECFVDMTGSSHLFGSPVCAAYELKDRIKNELGFTVNIGISNNKLLAKMASDFKKPDHVHTLFPNEIPLKMWSLPVSDLFYVGPHTQAKLHTLGIRTIGELAATDKQLLHNHLKSQGDLIWEFANGNGDLMDKVTVHPVNMGYGNSMTIPFDVRDSVTAKQVLLSLTETVATRIRADHAYISVVSVSIVDCDFNHASRQTSLLSATNITLQIYNTACKLFDALWNHAPIRQLGVHTSKATKDGGYQYSLFDSLDIDKYEKLDSAIDSIREKYGEDAIMRASFVKPQEKIEHMSGGLDKARRTGMTKAL
jgi:DNA polymerase-4